MRISPTAILITLSFAAAATASGWVWLTDGGAEEFAARGPFPADLIEVFEVALPGELENFEESPVEELPGSWPGFRGPARDGVSREDVALAESWPAEGPPVLWEVELGEGYAGAAIHRGRVYLLDYDEGRADGAVVKARRGDVLRCFALADGRELWRRWYHLPMVRYHGISRTVPAVSDRHVVSLGPMAHVLCCDAISGEALWSMDLVKRYGTVIPEWYAGQCPLIDELDGKEVAILVPGGDQGTLMIAVDCASGEVLWSSPNPEGWHMTHSSPIATRIQGEKCFLYCSTGGVVCVGSDGRQLWHFADWKISPAIVPTPVLVGDDRIFLCGGYKAGSAMLELGADEKFRPTVEELYRCDCRTFGAEQQTPIYFEECLYGVLTKNAGPRKEQLACLSPDGALLWSSGPENVFELGPFLIADGKLLLVNDSGVLTMVRPGASGYEQLARADVLAGHESWAPLAIAGGRFLVRDLRTMKCLDLRAVEEQR